MAEDSVRPTDRIQVLPPVREQSERKDRQPARKLRIAKRDRNVQPNRNDAEHGTLDVEA